MRTTIYNKVMRMATLFLMGGAMTTGVMAQENLHLFYKNGTQEKIEITEGTKVEFVKQPYLDFNYGGKVQGDTIREMASAGPMMYGSVRSNIPWTLSDNADWLITRQDKLPHLFNPIGDGMYDRNFLIFLAPNETDEERYAEVTINTNHGISKTFVVAQEPYKLSLEIMGDNFGFEPTITKEETIAWNDTLYTAVVYPNHGVKVLSFPKWMTLDTVYHGADDFSFEKVALVSDSVGVTGENINASYTLARFRFTHNKTPNVRTGKIIFEGHEQTAVLTVTQEGLTDATALAPIEDLQQWMVKVLSNHDGFSHMAVLHATDMMAEDMTMFNSGWFIYDYEHGFNAPTFRRNKVNWETYYGIITRANAVIDLMADIKDFVNNENFVLGNAYAYRAMAYLYLIQLFQDPTTEYGVNESLPGVPMLYAETEKADMTSEKIEYFKGRNTVGEVFAQIEADITRAVDLLQGEVRPSKNYIDVTVAQGIAARYYLLAQDWKKAANMANAARNTYRLMDGNTETNGIRDGFMDITNEEWMWGFDHTAETQTTYASFFSHISNLSPGYSGILYTGRGVDARLFEQMSASDYRRAYWYRDAESNTESTAAASPAASAWQYPYAILKFGWKEDWTQDYLYMRAAEMILIEAEAWTHLGNISDAAYTFAELMNRRDPNWSVHELTLEEIYLQRRLELIGEGHAYFDLKRLNKGVERDYEGSNHLDGYKLNVAAEDSSWVYKIPQSAINNDATYNLTDEDNLFIQDPVYLEETNYTSYNNDTIFMPASAGRAGTYGWVLCNRPWTVSTDADWLLARINESDRYDNSFTSEFEYENIFMVYAAANRTDKERVGHVTISTEQNVSKTFVVVQRPYTLSFNEYAYTNNLRYDGEPVDTFVIEGTWNYNNTWYNLYPNHGWQVTGYPDWMTMDEFVHGAEKFNIDSILADEDILAAGQPVVSSASFTFEPNESPEPRTAYIIFEGNGQKAVGIFHQEGLNEQSIINSASTLAKQMYQYGSNHADFGYPSIMLLSDSRGIDLVSTDLGYNWFGQSLTYGDINSSYWATAISWSAMYDQISVANEIIRAYDERADQSLFQFYLGQAYAFRAFNYFYLAQLYQQTYVGNEDALCVPLIHDGNMDIANTEGCPRATVREVYDFILSDLDKSLTMLQQTEVVRPSKRFVSAEVIYGLRARINMVRGEWQAAAADAQRVIEAGVAAPYSLEEVSRPTFDNINHAAWLWGIDTEETDRVVTTGICNWPSHIGSFSYGYAQVGAWRMVSKSLYESIPSTDVRKGWFLDANGASANLNAYQTAYIASAGCPAYTQVKFAPYNNKLGTNTNANDIPLMRIEEMYLIVAEAQAMMGDPAAGAATLQQFVATYRDPAYSCTATTAGEVREAVWMQRRIELWGEGHSYFDLMRMKKGVDRRGAGFEASYVYNIPAGDAALIYPIPDREMNANPQLIQNPVAEQPVPVEDVVISNISQVLVAGAGTEAMVEGTILATHARGFLVSDGTGTILVYLGAQHEYVAGDVVSVSGTVNLYGGLLQFPNSSVVEKIGHTDISYSEPTPIAAADLDAYLSAPSIQYVRYTGTLQISGSYYNVLVDGTDTAIAGITYPNDGLVDKAFDGMKIIVSGYLIGVTGGKYVNTMALNVDLDEDSAGHYVKVSDFTEEGTYIFVAGNQMLSRLNESKSYGYFPVGEVAADNDVIDASEATEMAKINVTAVDGGYTLQDTFGRYIFLKGDYNSFNVSTEAQESCVWDFTANDDGTFCVTNVDNGKVVMYDTQYSTYGCYPAKTDTRQYVNIYKYTTE